MIKVNIQEADHHLRIRVSSKPILLKLILSLALILVCFVLGAIAASNIGWLPSDEGTSIQGFWVCCSFVFVIIYSTVAVWLNRTVLDISRDNISVYRAPLPLPWARKRSTRTATIEQLFVQEIRNSVSNSAGVTYDWFPSYDVCALLKNGERVELLDLAEASGLGIARALRLAKNQSQATSLQSQAALIEERIERFLDIEDVPVENRVVSRHHYVPPTSGGGCGGGGQGG